MGAGGSARTNRFGDWVARHPVVWGVGAAAALVLLGVALGLPPVVVAVAGAAAAALNVRHARRRGYCPLPEAPGPRPVAAEDER